MALLKGQLKIWQETGGERGEVTRSKATRAGSWTQACCRASAHGTRALPTELNCAPLYFIFFFKLSTLFWDAHMYVSMLPIHFVKMFLTCISVCNQQWTLKSRKIPLLGHFCITIIMQVRYYDIADICLRRFSLTGPFQMLVEYPCRMRRKDPGGQLLRMQSRYILLKTCCSYIQWKSWRSINMLKIAPFDRCLQFHPM